MLHYRLHEDPRSSHQQIARLLREFKPAFTLDVGAAQGFLGQLTREAGLVIDAIEPRREWAEFARPHYRSIFATTVEQAELAPASYDAIVCADVLEHVPDPAGVLRRLRQAAKPDARFIISVPNVAHLAIRMMLLFGYFPKMDRGILDRTHLHYFTRDTAEELLRQAGLRVEAFIATGVPLEEVWRTGRETWLFDKLVRLQHILIDLAPRLFGFQWIFVARAAGP
jgi:2-polyprenyl-3-methyl-5-hydroxy-6-metoxy-1,4-benzoquinol methylase